MSNVGRMGCELDGVVYEDGFLWDLVLLVYILYWFLVYCRIYLKFLYGVCLLVILYYFSYLFKYLNGGKIIWDSFVVFNLWFLNFIKKVFIYRFFVKIDILNLNVEWRYFKYGRWIINWLEEVVFSIFCE